MTVSNFAIASQILQVYQLKQKSLHETCKTNRYVSMKKFTCLVLVIPAKSWVFGLSKGENKDISY